MAERRYLNDRPLPVSHLAETAGDDTLNANTAAYGGTGSNTINLGVNTTQDVIVLQHSTTEALQTAQRLRWTAVPNCDGSAAPAPRCRIHR